jgi:hypothetical protein
MADSPEEPAKPSPEERAKWLLQRLVECIDSLEQASEWEQQELKYWAEAITYYGGDIVKIPGSVPELADVVARFNRIVEGFPSRPGTQLRPVRIPGLDVPADPGGKPSGQRGLSIKGNDVTVDEITYRIDNDRAAFVRAVAGASGEWISGPNMGEAVGSNPSRTFQRIKKDHPKIAAWIESGGPRGFRLLSQPRQGKTG